MAGDYDPSSTYLLRSNFSLISCIPYFWGSTSRVSVPSGDTLEESGQITDIVTNTSSVMRIWPDFWELWIYQIPEYRIENPTIPSDADDFGMLAYNYAKRPNGAADLAQSSNTTFSVLFAAFATTSTYSLWRRTLPLLGLYHGL
jgi:hypothetical protein